MNSVNSMTHMISDVLNTTHDATPVGPGSYANTSMAMGMIGTFSTSTLVTLFFSDWTTDTPAKYFCTLIFLFLVTLLNRFLGAWRSQLGHKWANDAAEARRKSEQRREYRKSLKGKKTETYEPELDEFSTERAPLSPHLLDTDVEARKTRELRTSKWMAAFGGHWRAGNPWRLDIDVPRALLEGVRALTGYLLMLAVMTFNLGLLLTIILGIVFGELILGRFISGTGWEEGGCHDG